MISTKNKEKPNNAKLAGLLLPQTGSMSNLITTIYSLPSIEKTSRK